MVAYLLANGAEVDKTDDSGWTALHIAGGYTGSSHDLLLCVECIVSWFLVSSGHEEVVQELVGAGADMNKKNDKGITPLFVSRVSHGLTCCNDFGIYRHYAASKSRIEVTIRPLRRSCCTQFLL